MDYGYGKLENLVSLVVAFLMLMSLAIAASMFLCAYRIVSQNIGALLDRTLDEKTQNQGPSGRCYTPK